MIDLKLDCKNANNYEVFCLLIQKVFFELAKNNPIAISGMEETNEFVNLDCVNDLLEWFDFNVIPCRLLIYNYETVNNYMNKSQIQVFEEILNNISINSANNFIYEIM